MIYVRLIDLYACETYLNLGYSCWIQAGQHVPSGFKKAVIAAMKLVYKHGKYYGKEEDIWNFYSIFYNDILRELKITSYDQLLQKTRDSSRVCKLL